MRIRSWTYKADVHCSDCAAARFGEYVTSGLYGVWNAVNPVDSEGNPVRPIYSFEEVSMTEHKAAA